MEVALLEYIRRLTSQKSKRREKIKPYKRMKSLTDFLFGQRGEGNERNLNCLLYHTRPGGWGGGGYEEVDGSRDVHVSEGCLASG